MEILPHLRRFPKRLSLCLYITCLMFLACAFYTLYTESSTLFLTTSIHQDNSFQKRSDQTYFGDNLAAEVVPPATSWVSSVPNSTRINHATFKNIFKAVSPKSSKLTQVKTNYIYLKNSSTIDGATIRRTTNLPKATTTTTLPPDTCQTFSMKDSKLILMWTPFFEEWEYISQKRISECRRCRNCQVTNDRTKLNESDAVVFHARDMSLSDLPPMRHPHQRWIFFCLESPPYSDFPGLSHMVNMFNWTMTYRLDSDIVTPYGYVSKIRPPRKLDLISLQSSFNNKTKSVVWMSSHCPTDGGRDEYVDEMRKYIDVDVYGTCGTSICPPNGTNKCLRDFSLKYKFFLAFENTICKDYVTEKLYRNLEYNMVPVVFGGAEYSKLAPPSSFIEALSFKSPKHLAFFLAGIGKDFKLWSSYFRWKQDYSIDMKSRRECDLCSILHRRDLKRSSYGNFRKWWVGDANCRTWKPKR